MDTHEYFSNPNYQYNRKYLRHWKWISLKDDIICVFTRYFHLKMSGISNVWQFKLLMCLSILTYGFCSVIIFAVMLILLIKIMTDWIKIYLFRHYWCKMEIMPKINIDCNGDVNNRIQIYRKILIRRTRFLFAFETFLFIQTKHLCVEIYYTWNILILTTAYFISFPRFFFFSSKDEYGI